MRAAQSIILCFVAVWLCGVAGRDPHPVVIVPGLTASALQNIETGGRSWIDPLHFVDFNDWWKHPFDPLHVDTDWFQKHLQIEYNETAVPNPLQSFESIAPYPGLQGICNLSGIVEIDDLIHKYYINVMPEFQTLVDQIQGHSTGVTGVPYDWRLVPQRENMNQFLFEMESSIMELYNLYNRKVYIVAHSLGNMMTVWFLNNVDPTFTSTYVAGYIATSPPFGGAGLGLRAVVADVSEGYHGTILGKDWNVTVHFPSNFTGNMGSFPWVFPFGPKFADTTVVQWPYNPNTGTWTNYTASNIGDFIHTYPEFSNHVVEIFDTITSPDVFDYTIYETLPPGLNVEHTHLFVSNLEPTAIGVRKVGNDWQDLWEDTHGGTTLGDGTVPYASLHAIVGLWGLDPVHNVHTIDGVSHRDIISNSEFISTVLSIIEGNSLPGRV